MLGYGKRRLAIVAALVAVCLAFMVGAAAAETMGDPVPGLQVKLTDDVVFIRNATGDVEDETASISFQLIFGADDTPVPEGEIRRIQFTVEYQDESLELEDVTPVNWGERISYTECTEWEPGAVIVDLYCNSGTDTAAAIPTDSFTTFATLRFKRVCQAGGTRQSLTIVVGNANVDVKYDNVIHPYCPDPNCTSCFDNSNVTIIAPGDLNFDCKRNLADITDMIGSVYLGKILDPMAGLAADVTCDDKCTLEDITRLIDYVYLNGTAPGCP